MTCVVYTVQRQEVKIDMKKTHKMCSKFGDTLKNTDAFAYGHLPDQLLAHTAIIYFLLSPFIIIAVSHQAEQLYLSNNMCGSLWFIVIFQARSVSIIFRYRTIQNTMEEVRFLFLQRQRLLVDIRMSNECRQ